MKLVLLSGWKGSGKDTSANYLKTQGYAQYSLAGSLKEHVASSYNIHMELLNDPIFKEMPLIKFPAIAKDEFSKVILYSLQFELKTIENQVADSTFFKDGQLFGNVGADITPLHFSPRVLCILEGGVKRAVKPDFWVDQVLKKIKEDSPESAVVSDVRFKSEIESFKKSEFDIKTVRINRFETSQSEHASERDLDDYAFDHVIENTGTIKELEKKLRGIQ